MHHASIAAPRAAGTSSGAKITTTQLELFPGTREASSFHIPQHVGYFALCYRNPATIEEAKRISQATLDLADYLGHGDKLNLKRHLILGDEQAQQAGATSAEERIEQLRAQIDGKSAWALRQQCFPIALLPKTLEALTSRPIYAESDWWISQNGFSQQNRQAVNVLHINMIFVDIDIRAIGGPDHWLARMTPEQAACRLVQWCEDNGIPIPSVIVWSGNGLHAKWLFDKAVPRETKPAWDALQLHLGQKLEAGGWPVDTGARDVSRILRVIGTSNQKGGETCRIVWESGAGSDAWLKHDFNELMDGKRILPWTRAEARERRAVGAIWDENRKLARESRASVIELLTRPSAAVSDYLVAEMWHARLAAIRGLVTLRHGPRGVPAGQRNDFVWIAANALAWSCGGADNYTRNLVAVISELAPSLEPHEIFSRASAVSKRIAQPTGQDSGLFKMTNKKFREKLDITDAEASVLFSSATKRQPNPSWKLGSMGYEKMRDLPNPVFNAETKKRQAAAGVRSAAIRKVNAGPKSKRVEFLPKILAMQANGQTVRAIAKALAIPHPTVLRWLQTHKNTVMPCVAQDLLFA